MWRSSGASTASVTALSRPATSPSRAFQQGLVRLPQPQGRLHVHALSAQRHLTAPWHVHGLCKGGDAVFKRWPANLQPMPDAMRAQMWPISQGVLTCL